MPPGCATIASNAAARDIHLVIRRLDAGFATRDSGVAIRIGIKNWGSGIERLVEVLDQVLGIFESDRQARHAAGHARFRQLRVGVAPL